MVSIRLTLEEYRLFAGLTYAALGNRIGKSMQMAHHLCSGRRMPRAVVLATIERETSGLVNLGSFVELPPAP